MFSLLKDFLKKTFVVHNRDSYHGKDDALNDISNGKLIIRISGYPAKWVSTWIKILKKNNIQVINSGCKVYDGLLKYNEDYNEISESEIKRRFGDDFLEKTQQEAIEINNKINY